MAIYKGFSTKKFVDGGNSLRTYDIECVNDDLYRHIYTVFGERVYMPSFGTEVPVMTFEQNDKELSDSLKQQLKDVFDYDPRVVLNNLNVYAVTNQNALVAIANLTYIEFNVTQDLNLTFKN